MDFTSETEGDNTVFILAKKYATWAKQDGGSLANPTSFETKDEAVFYRLHYFQKDFDGESKAELNHLSENKAYLLIPTSSVPDALWKGSTELIRPYITIHGESDMEEYWDEDEMTLEEIDNAVIYNIQGQKVGTIRDGKTNVRSGLYIIQGKKVLIK